MLLEWSADQRVLVLWTLPGKPFVCVEPWSGPANALWSAGGITVPPRGAHVSTLVVTLG